MKLTETVLSAENRYTIKKMGTSGLREVQEVYNQPLFLEQFAQGIADYFAETVPADTRGKNRKILLGGDPRKGNRERIRVIAEIVAAAGFTVIIAHDGLASTPAMSHGIRHLDCAGGIILTASHNPFTDVGIKINTASGAPALEDTVERIHELQNTVEKIVKVDFTDAKNKEYIKEVDIITLYADLLDSIFDFASMKKNPALSRMKAVFDAMHGAAGPFAREVFINRLEVTTNILREEPREDLGGFDERGVPLHPEPDFDYIPELIEINSSGTVDLVSAWDSDVDRRLDGGSGFFIESADEFSLFARYSRLIDIEKLFDDTIYFCRSTVTADATDRMESYLREIFPGKKVRTVETPTGFKWIAELGNWGVEESNGVGNPYLREKDGIFSTVFLLKIILETGKTPRQLMEENWKDFGRTYFTRGEVSGDNTKEKDMLTDIFTRAGESIGITFGPLTLENAESWHYLHPVTGETAARDAAWVLRFSEGNTVKARFSGTGSTGYTLRVYCSKYDKNFSLPKSEITRPMKEAFDAFLASHGFPGKSKKFTDAHQPDIYG